MNSLTSAKEVLLCFLIPFGGGIPAGVVLAQKRGLSWLVMLILYFISDCILACVFEPLMLLFLRASEKNSFLFRLRQAFAETTKRSTARFGLNPRPFSIIMISFGVDPMTGRSVSKAVGHGFIVGWLLTIIGDMFYFAIIMVSTLWLNSILGDGTLAAVIIMVVMLAAPPLWRRLRGAP